MRWTVKIVWTRRLVGYIEVSSECLFALKSTKLTVAVKGKRYRSTGYSAFILGLCNFLTPGIWDAVNSLGGGGEENPYLVIAANALTFGLMVISVILAVLKHELSALNGHSLWESWDLHLTQQGCTRTTDLVKNGWSSWVRHFAAISGNLLDGRSSNCAFVSWPRQPRTLLGILA